jgi:hypothetical protein
MAKIIGNTTATPNPRPDWAQTDETKADYIKNKPSVANAIKGFASGNPIRLDDVSPLEHEISAKATKTEIKTTCEKVADTVFAVYNNYELESRFLTVTEITPDDYGGILVLDDSSYWINENGQMQAEDDGSARFDEIFSVGDVVYVDFDDPENPTWYLYKATATETIVPANGATIEKYGKNLFDVGVREDYDSSGYIDKIENDIIYTRIRPAGEAHFVNTSCAFTSGTYSISSTIENGFASRPLVRLYGADGAVLSNATITLTGWNYNSFYKGWFNSGNGGVLTVPKSSAYWCLGFAPTGPTGETATISNIQVELGSTATEYEKCHCKTYTADENGNVDGIIGNGETVTLLAESGVTISVEYNRDINKVIESLVNAIIALGGTITQGGATNG